MLGSLVKLDNAEVTPEERQQARLMNFDNIEHKEPPMMQRKPSSGNVLQ